MSEDIKTTEAPVENQEQTTEPYSNDKVQELINAEVKKALSSIKGNLDKAYAERDQYKSQISSIEADKQKAEIEALEKQGKHAEVKQMEIDKLTQRLNDIEKANTELSRDNAVRAQLNALDFRNDVAADMAYNSIVKGLSKNSEGNWVHSTSLKGIEETVSDYAANDANAFLFKAKANSGTGTQPAKQASGEVSNKPLKEMTTEEALKAAEAGQFDHLGEWSQ